MKKQNRAFVIFFTGAVLITMAFFFGYAGLLTVLDGDVSIGPAVAVVDIVGEIGYDLGKVQEIEGHRDNDKVRGVLLHVDSPGGGVAASQAVYHAVRSLRQVKPVVAFMGPVAASGGYYIACGADSIFAHEGTITGSIGVIASYMRTQELYRKIGLDVTVIKTGKYKDVGSEHRPMTDEERQYLGNLLNRAYEQFIRAVGEGRAMPEARVRELADGRLYTGEEAQEVGLVDRIGTYEEALHTVADMAGIEGEPHVIRRKPRRTLIDRVLGDVPMPLGMPDGDGIHLEYRIP